MRALSFVHHVERAAASIRSYKPAPRMQTMFILWRYGLTNEELVTAIKNNPADAQELAGQLYEQNKGLIRVYLQPFIDAGLEEADAMQDAFFAILDAVQRYNPERGKFATCLRYSILNIVVGNFKRSGDVLRLPAYKQTLISNYCRVSRTFEAEHGAPAPDVVIRRRLQISQDQLNELRQTMANTRPRSLEEPIADNLTIADAVADPTDRIQNICDQLAEEQDARQLWAAVETLQDEQKNVLKVRYRDGQTVRQTAEQLNTTPGKVTRAENNGLRRLKNNKAVRRMAADRGFYTRELFGSGLNSFRITGYSIVERAALRRLEGNHPGE